MVKTDEMSSSLGLHYSPSTFFSIGYQYENFKKNNFQMNAFQVNNLLYRRNTLNSQANIYLRSALGLATCSDNSCGQSSQFGYSTGILSDWETQRLFVSYSNRYLNAYQLSHFFSQSARIGVAPYVGDFGDLHTWLMVEVNHAPGEDVAWSVTPLIRLFKSTHLFEAGVNNRGNLLINFVERF